MSARASPLLGLGDDGGAGWMAIYGAAGGQNPQAVPEAGAPATPSSTDIGTSDYEYEQEYPSEESEGPELINTYWPSQRPLDAEIVPAAKPQPAPQPPVNGQMGQQAVQPSPPAPPAFALTQFLPLSTNPCTTPCNAMPLTPAPNTATGPGALPPCPPLSNAALDPAALNAAAAAAAVAAAAAPSPGAQSSSAAPSVAPGAGVPSPAPSHEQAGQNACALEVAGPFPDYTSVLRKVRKYMGDDYFLLTREACKRLQQNAERAIVFWKVVHGLLLAHERDLFLDEMEFMDIQAHHNANTSKNEWRNQFNYLSHMVRWVAAYGILSQQTVEQAAQDIQSTKGYSNFENWKNRAPLVLPHGSPMRMAWDKVGCRSPDTDKRTRDRLEMYAAGCAVYVEL